jgi:hypothetical protein
VDNTAGMAGSDDELDLGDYMEGRNRDICKKTLAFWAAPGGVLQQHERVCSVLLADWFADMQVSLVIVGCYCCTY